MTLKLLESITHNDIIKTLWGKRDYAISEINDFFKKGQAFFPSGKKEGRNISLFSEMRKSGKGQMF